MTWAGWERKIVTVVGTAGRGLVDDVRVDGREGGGRRPDPEVEPKARRRSFSAAYKLRILTEYEAAPDDRKTRSCGERICTRRISWSGVRPERPGRRPGCRNRRDAPRSTIVTRSWRSSEPRTRNWRRNWRRPSS
ncbi:hypothetical protein FAIPA1_700003 [Frankia sp. AiPs1]